MDIGRSLSGRNSLNGVAAKKKMTKAEVQLAIVKKKQCDAVALAIVERLIESNVDEQWLLENLKHISKCHMEDVTEERAITKLCGYVLCDKPLTVVINQKYHISTKNNKVYDVTKRKNFCSAKCYGATNYILEQMLISPLWLRDKEDIPNFQLSPLRSEKEKHSSGEEITFKSARPSEINDITKDIKKCNVDSVTEEVTECTVDKIIDELQTEHLEEAEIANTSTKVEDFLQNGAQIEILATSNQENDIKIELSNLTADSIVPATESEQMNVPVKNIVIEKSLNDEVVIKEESFCLKKESKNKSKIKDKVSKKKKAEGDTINSIITQIEKSFDEWITEDTLSLVSADESKRQQILESITIQQSYTALCKKLHRLEMREELEDRALLEEPNLKPLPHYHILQEEGKKLELKVRAFYKGKTVIEAPEKVLPVDENSETETNFGDAVMPLTDARNHHAVRRKIFLDKLNTILPDLLCALAGGGLGLPASLYNYDSERTEIVKALVNTFSLSAKNIVFKAAEWTLVGLIIIKMSSVLDAGLKKLMSSKQATMCVSMILMTYKLEPNYLDNLIASLVDRKTAS